MRIKPYKLVFLAALLVTPFTLAACTDNNNPTEIPTTLPSTGGSSVLPTTGTVSPTTGGTVNDNKPTSLENLSDLDKVIKYSVDNTYLVKSDSTVKDGDTTVYRVERTISIEDTSTKKGSSVTYYYNLDSDFKLTRTTDVKTFESLDVDTLFSGKLDDSYFTSKSISTTSVSLQVKSQNAKDYFQDDTVSSSTDVSVLMTISDFKITKITISYSLDNKTINSEINYSYLA